MMCAELAYGVRNNDNGGIDMKNVFKCLAVMTGVMGMVGLARADDPYADYVQ